MATKQIHPRSPVSGLGSGIMGGLPLLRAQGVRESAAPSFLRGCCSCCCCWCWWCWCCRRCRWAHQPTRPQPNPPTPAVFGERDSQLGNPPTGVLAEPSNLGFAHAECSNLGVAQNPRIWGYFWGAPLVHWRAAPQEPGVLGAPFKGIPWLAR